MPDTLVAPPPTATTTPASPSIAFPPSPPPPPPPKPPVPTDPKPVPATAKKPSERAGDDLSKFADKGEAKSDPKADALNKVKRDEAANSEIKPVAEKDKPADKPVEGEVEAGKVEAEPVKQGKVWKVLKETEAKLATVEKEYNEFKAKASVDPEKEKQVSERIRAMEKREKELIEELRFHNFEKYDEDFKKNYETPYQSAWHNAVEEITQLPVTAEDGSVRAGTASDLSALMELPPVERHEMAERMFGKFAVDAVREAKEVKRLFDKRNVALQEERKTLGEKFSKRQEEAQNFQKTVSEEVGKVWQEADQEAFSHEKFGEYFKPVEGDAEGNQRLAKGRALAQRAFTENPFDRKLTPSDRAAIVKRQNAVCNRASAFGRLVQWNKALKSELAELKKEVGQYKNGEPGGGEGKSGATEPPMTPTQRAMKGLADLAH